MSRPTKTSSQDILKLMKEASFDNEASMIKYIKRQDALKAAEKETEDKRKIESGYKAEIDEAKKKIRNSKKDIFDRTLTIGGFDALEELNQNELKKTQRQILVADALSIFSAIENEEAAKSKEKNLKRIKANFNSWTSAIAPLALPIEDREEIKPYVAQLKKEVDELKKLEASDPRRFALERYIRAITTTATLTRSKLDKAADSIRDNGYIVDTTLRDAIVVELEKLLNKYSVSPLSQHAAHEKALVIALIDKEISYHQGEKTLAEDKKNSLTDITKLEIGEAKEIAAQQKIILDAQEKILEADENLAAKNINEENRNTIFQNEENKKKEALEALDNLITTATTTTLKPWSINIIKRAEKAHQVRQLVSTVNDKIEQVLQIIDSINLDQKINDIYLRTEAHLIFGSNYDRSQDKVITRTGYSQEDAIKQAQKKIAELISIRSKILAGKAIPNQEKPLAKSVFFDHVNYTEIERKITRDIPIVENHLNGSDYEPFIEILFRKNQSDNFNSKNDTSKKQIELLEQKRKDLSQSLEKAPTPRAKDKINFEISIVEERIVEEYKKSKGLTGQINYLKELKQESKIVQIRNLEVVLINEKRRKEEAEKIVTDDEKKLPITERRLKLANEEVNKLVTEAEKETNSEEALKAREKAILKQRELFGERGVHELATRWEDKYRKPIQEKMELLREIEVIKDAAENDLAPGSRYLASKGRLTLALAMRAVRAEQSIMSITDDLTDGSRYLSDRGGLTLALAKTALNKKVEIDDATRDLTTGSSYLNNRSGLDLDLAKAAVIAEQSIRSITNDLTDGSRYLSDRGGLTLDRAQRAIDAQRILDSDTSSQSDKNNAAIAKARVLSVNGDILPIENAVQIVARENERALAELARDRALQPSGDLTILDSVSTANSSNGRTERQIRIEHANQIFQREIERSDAESLLRDVLEGNGRNGNLQHANEIVQREAQKAVAQNELNDALSVNGIIVGNITDAHDICRREMERSYAESLLRDVFEGDGRNGNLQHANEIVQREAERDAAEFTLNDVKDKVAKEIFVFGGSEEVEKFYDSTVNDIAKKDKAQSDKNDAYSGETVLKTELYQRESEKEDLENEISELQKKIDLTTDALLQARSDRSSTFTLENDHDSFTSEKETADHQLQTLKTRIDFLKSALTLSVMIAGGQKLLAGRAEEQIETLSNDIASKESKESEKLDEAFEAKKAVEDFQDGIDEKLNKYIIKIDDLSSKQPETYLFDQGVTKEKIPSIPSEEAKFINLASKVTASLFDLNDDNNPEMDLVPELRDSVGIKAKPKSGSVKIYVAFNDPKKAAAFCSKMNNFKKSGSNDNIINAAFVTGFDEYGEPKIAEQGKDKWKRYNTPKLEDENNDEFDKKYVVFFEAGHDKKFSKFTFADEIIQSEKAKKVTDRAENARWAERIREGKDEPIKTVIAALTNVGGVTPLVASVAAIAMDVLVTSPLKFLRLPGSSVVSTANQAMYDYAAFATKRGNVLSFFSPDTAKKFGASLENSSKKLLKKEEKNTAEGIRPFRDDWSLNTHFINNGFNTAVIFGTGISSLCFKGGSYIGHAVGDVSFKLTKICTDKASKEWSQGGLVGLFPCGLALLGAAVGIVIGTTFRGMGIGFGGIGEALSKPAKAAYPKDSVKENRNWINQKIWGSLIHRIDRNSDELRKNLFTPEEKSELKIPTEINTPKMTSNQIKAAKADSKTEFDEVIRKFAIDIKSPKFNKSSLIKGEKNEYMKIAELNFNDSTYIVSLGANNTVAVAEVGAVNDHAANNFPKSLQGKKTSDFAKALFNSLSDTMDKKESSGASPATPSDSAPSTMREFGLKFGGITSSTSSPTKTNSPGVLLKSYLGDKYVTNTVRNVDVPGVGKYSVKVDGDNKIHIGKVGQNLEVIKEGEEAKSTALAQVVLSFGEKPTNTGSPSPSFYTKPQERGRLVVERSDNRIVERSNDQSYPGGGRRL